MRESRTRERGRKGDQVHTYTCSSSLHGKPANLASVCHAKFGKLSNFASVTLASVKFAKFGDHIDSKSPFNVSDWHGNLSGGHDEGIPAKQIPERVRIVDSVPRVGSKVGLLEDDWTQ